MDSKPRSAEGRGNARCGKSKRRVRCQNDQLRSCSAKGAKSSSVIDEGVGHGRRAINLSASTMSGVETWWCPGGQTPPHGR